MMGLLYIFLELIYFTALATNYVISQDPGVYDPSLGYLNCSTTLNHSHFVFNDGEVIQLLCRSETKGPQAFLQWSATGDGVLPITSNTVYLSDDRSLIVSTLTLTVDHSFDGVSFNCSRRSSLFLPIVDYCILGPFYVNPLTPFTTTFYVNPPTTYYTGISTSSYATLFFIVTIVIIILFVLLISSLLILCKSGKLITCKPSNDSSRNASSNDESGLENQRNDNQVMTGNQLTTRSAAEEATMHPNAEQRSNSNDQYTDLNLADVGNSTYTDLKHRPSPNQPPCNTSAEPHRYDNANVQESNPATENQYMGLNTDEIGNTIYMGLLKSNKHEASQMYSPNQEETKNGAFENGDVDDETSDYVNVI